MELPLFPLNTVLFPGVTLPLHIFEERYKQMIASCLREKGVFGVLLIRSGSEVGGGAEPFDVGTTAQIARVEYLPEGRMNLVCVGGQRFRMRETTRQEPYLVGDVEILEVTQDNSEQTAEMAGNASALFAEYVRLSLAVTNQWAKSVEMPADPDLLADFIASRLMVNVRTKQRLLEELSPRTRLALEVQLLGDAIRELGPGVDAARAMRWRGFSVMN